MVFAVFGIAGHDQAGRTARNTAAHSPAVGTSFGIFQAQVAGIAQTVINQRGNFFLTAGRGIGRVKNRRTGRQVGSEADLLGVGCSPRAEARGSRTMSCLRHGGRAWLMGACSLRRDIKCNPAGL